MPDLTILNHSEPVFSAQMYDLVCKILICLAKLSKTKNSGIFYKQPFLQPMKWLQMEQSYVDYTS